MSASPDGPPGRRASPSTIPSWTVRLLRKAVWLLVIVAALALLVRGANRPPDPYLKSPGLLEGFGRIVSEVGRS